MPGESRGQRSAQTRARLLLAAKQVFEEHGYLPARVADIVKAAGVAHGSFYHYFDSKEDVFRELADQSDAALMAPMQEIILDPHSGTPTAERIRASVRQFLVAYQQEAAMIGLVEQVSRHDEHLRETRRKRLQRDNEQLAASIAALQRRGEADPTLDSRLTAALLGSMTTRFPEAWLVEGIYEATLDDVVDQITKIFVNALGLKTPGGH
jgi:AcrR family transcriptional regulator